jgi:hypothetical protein
VLDPATPSDYAHILFFIKGAEAFRLKKNPDRAAVGLRAKDPRTLVVELENPCPYFPELCAFFVYNPVRKDVVEKHGTQWTRVENMVVNGPFKLADWKPTDSITVEKNPKYWDAAKVKLRKIKFLPIENRATAWNLYNNGQCDWVTTLPLELIEEIVKRPDYHGDKFLGTYYYSCNVTHPALKDKRVRKALALVIDRETLTTKITKQGQIPAYHFTPYFEGTRVPGWTGRTCPTWPRSSSDAGSPDSDALRHRDALLHRHARRAGKPLQQRAVAPPRDHQELRGVLRARPAGPRAVRADDGALPPGRPGTVDVLPRLQLQRHRVAGPPQVDGPGSAGVHAGVPDRPSSRHRGGREPESVPGPRRDERVRPGDLHPELPAGTPWC